VNIELKLTKREVDAVRRCSGFDNGYGVVKSQALQSAEMKLRQAIMRAEPVEDGTT
jgi:hypothetical protein